MVSIDKITIGATIAGDSKSQNWPSNFADELQSVIAASRCDDIFPNLNDQRRPMDDATAISLFIILSCSHDRCEDKGVRRRNKKHLH
jgi:hypothetical protein